MSTPTPSLPACAPSPPAGWFQGFLQWRLYIRNPVPLRTFVGREASPAARRLMAGVYAHELTGLGQPGWWRRTAMVLAWAGVMTRSCFRHYAKHRAAIRRELPDTGVLAHWSRLGVSVFLNNISPLEFYRYKFYLARFYRHRRLYVLRWQLDALLIRALPNDGSEALADKYHFWQAADRAGLAVVPVWASVHHGTWQDGDWASLAAKRSDLVLKPTNRARGEGIEFLDALPGGGWLQGSRPLDDAQACAWLEAASHRYPVIVQPRIRNHPELARYGAEGLATLRIVTMKTRRMAGAVCVLAALRVPHGTARLANLHQRALVCAVDLASGRMSPGSGVSPADEDLAHHPVTGAPLAGERVPCWEACKALCIAGHGLAPGLNSIGWDVIVAPDGPRLLEANVRWGCHVLQIAGGTPLLATRFPELYEAPA